MSGGSIRGRSGGFFPYIPAHLLTHPSFHSHADHLLISSLHSPIIQLVCLFSRQPTKPTYACLSQRQSTRSSFRSFACPSVGRHSQCVKKTFICPLNWLPVNLRTSSPTRLSTRPPAISQLRPFLYMSDNSLLAYTRLFVHCPPACLFIAHPPACTPFDSIRHSSDISL